MRNLKIIALGAVALVLAIGGGVVAQTQLLPNTVFIGKMYSQGNQPTIGAPCTIQAGATNRRGRVTAVGVATCTVTFVADTAGPAAPNFWLGASPPVCMVNDETGTRAAMSTTASSTTLVVAGLTAGDVFTYLCEGGS